MFDSHSEDRKFAFFFGEPFCRFGRGGKSEEEDETEEHGDNAFENEDLENENENLALTW